MSKYDDLQVKPTSTGTIVAVPLSSGSIEGKASAWAVRKSDGSDLVKADASTGNVTLAPLAGKFRLPVYSDDTARDAAVPTPTGGEMVFNVTSGTVEFHDGSNWILLPKS